MRPAALHRTPSRTVTTAVWRHPLRHLAVVLAGACALLAPAWAVEAVATAADAAPLVSAAPVAPAVPAPQDFDWTDEARQRAVPARLYAPAGFCQGAPVPLVVFSHGIGGSRRGYSYLGQHFAAQGFASLHLQHVGSDRSLWGGNPLALVGRLQAAAQESEAVHRVHDLRFALDQLLSGPQGRCIDATRIAAAGHSYGANTTLLAVGARVERDGQALALRDPRLKAAIVISAPPFYGERSVDRVLGAIDVPTLHVTATEDVIRIPGYFSPADDRIAVYGATGGRRKVLAVFEGGSHSIFTDRAGTGGAALNPQVKAATQTLAATFLRDVFFGGADDALLRWRGRYQPLLARFERVVGAP